MADESLFLGLDIGGTKSAVIVGTASGQILARSSWPSLAQRGVEAMVADQVAQARELLAQWPGVRRIGVSIGGPLDAERGVIYSPPNLPGWDAFPLKQRLEKALNLPVFVEHDAAACALAEYLWGAGQGAEALAYLTCGTGFGSGFVFRGRPYRGAHGSNSEIGHMTLRPDGPAAFGKTGSAEAMCSGTGLSSLAAWRFAQRWKDSPPRGQEIAQLARQGDAQAQEILDLSADAVGDVCAILADILRLDLILIGSLGRYLGDGWMQRVRGRCAAQSLPAIGHPCRIEPAGLGDRLQDCSALVVAVRASGDGQG